MSTRKDYTVGRGKLAVPKVDSKTLLKFLDEGDVSPYARRMLPIGKWVKVNGPLQMCRTGIHVTTIGNAQRWLNPQCHVVSVRGDTIRARNKICCREVYIHPANPYWNGNGFIAYRNAVEFMGARYAGRFLVELLNGRVSDYRLAAFASMKVR